MESEEKDLVKEPFTEYGVYSYADYLTWEIDEMVELIKGKVFRSAAAAPRRKHQEVAGLLHSRLLVHLEDIYTVVQPDICVVCDRSKLDEAGCVGAPDLIVEVLSPGNNKKEVRNKYEVYEESGVREYWIIHPSEETMIIYSLVEGKYKPSRLFSSGDVVKSECIPGFELDLEEFFEKID